MTMMLIGVDPHKSTSTATVVEPESNREVASMRIEATLREYRRLLTWAGRWPERRWANWSSTTYTVEFVPEDIPGVTLTLHGLTELDVQPD